MTLINGPRIIFISTNERREPEYRANPTTTDRTQREERLKFRAFRPGLSPRLCCNAATIHPVQWHAVYGPEEVHRISARGAMADRGYSPHDQEQVN